MWWQLVGSLLSLIIIGYMLWKVGKDMKDKIKYVRYVFPLALVGNYTETEKIIDENLETIIKLESFVGVWFAEDTNKYGHETQFGRNTATIYFGNLKDVFECCKKLNDSGVSEKKLLFTTEPIKTKVKLPLFASVRGIKDNERLKKIYGKNGSITKN